MANKKTNMKHLKQLENVHYMPTGFVELEDAIGNIVPGTRRSLVSADKSAVHCC